MDRDVFQLSPKKLVDRILLLSHGSPNNRRPHSDFVAAERQSAQILFG
jgi:hypothetical protein